MHARAVPVNIHFDQHSRPNPRLRPRKHGLGARERIDHEAQLATACLEGQRALYLVRRHGHRVEDVVEAAIEEFFRFL